MKGSTDRGRQKIKFTALVAAACGFFISFSSTSLPQTLSLPVPAEQSRFRSKERERAPCFSAPSPKGA